MIPIRAFGEIYFQGRLISMCNVKDIKVTGEYKPVYPLKNCWIFFTVIEACMFAAVTYLRMNMFFKYKHILLCMRSSYLNRK